MSKITANGVLSKMPTNLLNGVAIYTLKIGDNNIRLNDIVGSNINFAYKNAIYCANCGGLTKKSYSQGYCYLCSQKLACCDLCIMKPETCHYHLGTCREPSWGEDNCFKEHIVYLANSSGIKVGITKSSNVPNRWIDQGAVSALPIFKVAKRIDSGLLEVKFKQLISDKTNWRKMLKNEVEFIDLKEQFKQLLPQIDIDIKEVEILQEEQINISYPVLEYPIKVSSLNFDKTPNISGKLLGVKGQYLILDIGVLNIRKFSSYLVDFNVV